MNINFEDEVNQILQTYKISKEAAFKILTQNLDKDVKLKRLIDSTDSQEDIKRTSLYKDFIKRVRKEIYYSLRTYRPENLVSETNDFTELAKSHISTKERMPYLDEFNNELIDALSNTENLIDIGGGLLPLVFPFDRLPKLKKYIWMDKDKKAYDVVSQFAKTESRLKPYNHAIGEQEWEFYLTETGGIETFDTALMVKLIPVIARQEKILIDVLTNVPAKQILLTASKEAMVKHRDIQARENKTLLSFIDMTRRTIVKKIEIENEFGYLII